MTDIVNKNTGVLLTEPQPGDFIAGASSPIVFEARNKTADWIQFQSSFQRQSDSVFDTSGCVSFSQVTGVITPQINFFLMSGILDRPEYSPIRNFLNTRGYLVNGRFEGSERAIVVWSGTTPQGNSGQNVIQAIRASGIPSAKTWPNLLNDLLPNGNNMVSREEYFTAPSPAAVTEGLEFLKYFKFAWEFIPSTDQGLIRKYLQQSPLQEYTPVCPGWGTVPVVQMCNQPIQHATAIQAIDTDGELVIEDQYPPFTKKLASNYIPASAPLMRIVVYPIPQTVITLPPSPSAPRYQFNRDLVLGERSQDVLHLQLVLGIQQTGIYDSNTASAVFQFQLKNLSSLFLEMILNLKGRRVGPRTRAVLNK